MDSDEVWSGTARVMRGEVLVEEHSVGLLDGPDSASCWPGMRSQACSISKLVLAVAVLKLTELGTLDLHAPIRHLLEVPAHWSTITMHQLLSHTSGIGHWGDIPGVPPMLHSPPPRDELFRLSTQAALVFPPGEGWCYSGPGSLLACLVVEAATERPYSAVVNDLVFTPAGMTSTSSGEHLVGRAGAATGHVHGVPQHLHPGFAEVTGSGDLWTTTADLIRLNQALRSGDVLEPASAAQLWTPHATLPEGDQRPSAIQMQAYGYGTFLGQINGRAARINPGDNPGYQTLLAFLPDDGVDVAILGNEDAPSVSAALRALVTLR